MTLAKYLRVLVLDDICSPRLHARGGRTYNCRCRLPFAFTESEVDFVAETKRRYDCSGTRCGDWRHKLLRGHLLCDADMSLTFLSLRFLL